MTDNTTGNHNIAIGENCLGDNTSGTDNVAIGMDALRFNTTGTFNTAVGTDALGANTGADNITAVGRNALGANTTGASNTAVGAFALDASSTANNNTAVGVQAMTNSTTAFNVTSTGYAALYSLTTGDNNTAFGFQSGYNVTTGTGNVCLGYKAGQDQISTTSNQLYIARSNTAKGNAETWIQGDDAGAVYQGNNSSSWSTTSDRRLKKNIVDSSKGLAEVNQLRVTNFEYRLQDEIDMSEFPLVDDPSKVVIGGGQEGEVQIGVIAQEIESVLPECIKVSEEGAKTVNSDPIMWAMLMQSRNSLLK
jgi:hypothetical protein